MLQRIRNIAHSYFHVIIIMLNYLHPIGDNLILHWAKIRQNKEGTMDCRSIYSMCPNVQIQFALINMWKMQVGPPITSRENLISK